MHEALIGYYPESAHDEIASLLGKSPHHLDDDFQAEIAEVLFILDNGDALGQSPQKHSRDTLQLIATRAQALVEALESINKEAWWVLDKEFSERKGLDRHRNKANGAPEGTGCTEQNDDPFGELILQLQQLDELARVSLNAFRQTGRPANRDIPEAIRRLRRIWTNTTKADPTVKHDKKDPGRGRFHRFCQLVLTPTLIKYGRPLQLERAVRNELYGQKPRRKSKG